MNSQAENIYKIYKHEFPDSSLNIPTSKIINLSIALKQFSDIIK